jgi:hypothetical protein
MLKLHRPKKVMQVDCVHDYESIAERGNASAVCFVVCKKCHARLFEKTLEAQVGSIPGMKLKGRRKGMGKPFIIVKALKERWRDEKKFVQRIYVTDREAGRFIEKVVDPETSSVVHQCDEPLSKHHNVFSLRS